MNWKVYLNHDGNDAEIFLDILRKKWNHETAPRDGEFIGGVRILDIGHNQLSAPEPEHISGQIPIISQALSDSGFYEMVVGMMDYFAPALARQINNSGLGCSCGIYGDPIWRSESPDVTIMSTIDTAVGCAEGIVHELGHYKLHAVGINLEDWGDLIGNDPAELFESPVRYDKLRPMGAVIQAQFSYVYVTKFYIPLIERAMEEGNHLGPSLEAYYMRQAYNLKRIGNGIHTIRKHYKKGDRKFIKAFINLAEKTWYDAYLQFPAENDYDWEPVCGKP